ncbi:hypothetical protein BDW66DRAFT_112309 [Aspergillus desertorum]
MAFYLADRKNISIDTPNYAKDSVAKRDSQYVWKHEGVWYLGVRKQARLNTNEMLTKTVQTGHPRTGEEPMLRQYDRHSEIDLTSELEVGMR